MNSTFPTPSDVVGALRTMHLDTSESGPQESIFSLLLHSNGQLCGTACLPAYARETRLQACAEDARNRADWSMVVLVAVCDDPEPALRRAASFFRPHPRMLIGTDSLMSGRWTEFVSGKSGVVESRVSRGTQRFLGHWEYCSFSDAFRRDREKWYSSTPTRFKSIDKPLEQFVKNITNRRPSADTARTGGILVYSETSRDEALRAVDLSPEHALETFRSAARNLTGHARIEALVAAGVAAFFAGNCGIAEHAYLVAAQEAEQEVLRFDHRMLSALGALVAGKVTAKTATELVAMHPPVARLGEPSMKTA